MTCSSVTMRPASMGCSISWKKASCAAAGSSAHLLGARGELAVVGHHALGLALVDEAVGLGRQQLGLAAVVGLRGALHEVGNLHRLRGPELMGGPGRAGSHPAWANARGSRRN